MATKRALIEQAFDEIGLSSYTWNSTNPRWNSALTRMNRMAAMWESRVVLTGFNIGGSLDDESGVPDTAEEAFVSNLAVRVAPTIGKAVSRETMVAADQSYKALISSKLKVLQSKRPGIMPLGRGNRIHGFSQNFVVETDDLTIGQGSPLEA